MKAIGFLLIVIVLFALGILVLIELTPEQEPRVWGVTFSSKYMKRFKEIDWHDAYRSMLDDLAVKHLRLPVYWDDVEYEQGAFDPSEIEWQLDEAAKRDVEVIVVVGKKVPRWPECHIPSWARDLPQEEQDDATIDFVKKIVSHLKDRTEIVSWQVENEPFLDFGECPLLDKAYVDRAIEAVYSVDDRPIVITDSGEISLWVSAAKRGDIFGTTMYRHVWNDYTGLITYPLPPKFFRLKRSITELIVGKKPMIVIELQAESWLKRQAYETTPEEQFESFNPERFTQMISYASQSGFDTFYLWGVEWWYWLNEVHDMPEMWEYARGLFAESE